MSLKITIQKITAAIVFWQFISVGLMAVGVWPDEVAVVNALLLAIFILVASPFRSILLLITSIPFFVILPNPLLVNLPMWRPLFVLLFAVWFVRLLINQRALLFKNLFQRANSRLRPWDKVAALFLILTLCSLLLARFPMHGLKQILFLVNVYVLYIVIVNVVTDESKLKELIRYTRYSLMIMVGLGFVQYFSTLFSLPYYFWQYWAIMVSSLYYGLPLGNVLAYSNSWFSDAAGAQAIRMFGVLPDTHAFGVMCILLLAFFTPFVTRVKETVGAISDHVKQRKYWYAGIFLAGFGVMASGTRGVWASLLIPLGISVLAYFLGFIKPFFKNILIIYAIVIGLFIASPLISQGLNAIRTYDVDDNFLDRASSIYDLSESSNLGRLEIWKNSAWFAASHPFGVGYGNFITSLVTEIPNNVSYEDLASAKNLRYNLPEGFITAHSLYLQLLVELGFAGLLAFILYWWEFFESLWQFVKKHGTSLTLYTNLVASLGFAFIWILAYGLFDVTILNDRVLQYLFISIAISSLIFTKYEQFTQKNEE
jgi:hypothetical protein